MAPMVPAVDSKKPAHWTVRTNYRLRVGSFALVFASVAFHGYESGLNPVLWVFAVLQLLVYPHVAYVLARRAANSQQAEVNNLTVDCFLFGILAAALEFPLWITFNFYVASTLNITISRGVAGLLRSQLAFCSGALMVVALLGWHVSAATGWPATALSVLGNLVYMMAIGIAAYRRNLQLRETREALRLRTTELSTTLAQLQQSQENLLEAEKLASLGSLVAGVAHELNTPLGNALVTATAMEHASKSMAHEFTAGTMKRSALETFLMRSSEMSDLIVRSCQRAVNLIVSFKKVAVDQASEQQRLFDLRDVVADNLLTTAPSLKNPGLEMVNQVPASIVCDSYPGALGQVLTNLLQNAALHAFEAECSGRMLVQASANATHATLTVRDNGKGMRPEVLKHVFDPFYTTRLGQGGSGLGLTICRNIVTGVLGGTLQVQSTLGQGSVFTITFPLKAQPARPINVYHVAPKAAGAPP
jgi:signal transduction histidine kinase